MTQNVINPSVIAQESLFQLENNVIMGDRVHRQYKKEFVKIGNTVTIRKPVKFKATDGATRSNQDVIENTTSIVINNRKHVSWKFSTVDLTLTIEQYSERYIKPAMIVLANEIDKALCVEGEQRFPNVVGTPGTTPADFQSVADVSQRLDELPAPDDGNRCLILNPAGRWGLANGLGGTGSGGIFNAEIVGGMVRKGKLGNIANLDIYGDQNIQLHTNGPHTGTALTAGATAVNATAIAFDGMVGTVTGAIKKGDAFTMAGVFAVNDVSKDALPYLKQFVAMADVDTTAGVGSILINDTAVGVVGGVGSGSGVTINDGSDSSTAAFQNVTALPADNAAITFVGAASSAHPQNLAFHKNALALVTVPLELPDSAVFKARADWRGYSIRVIKAYDIDDDEEIIRLDILFGVKAIYPELGVRLTG